MSNAREIAQRFFDTLCAGDFEGGFGRMMTDDATWTVTGPVAVSKTRDRAGMMGEQLDMLLSFKEPPMIGIDDIIAEGDSAVVIAHCKGVGPTGVPYEQKSYAFLLRMRDGKVASVTEYLDTVAVETGICGNKVVPA